MDNKNNRVVFKNENQIEVKIYEWEMSFTTDWPAYLHIAPEKCNDTSRGSFCEGGWEFGKCDVDRN